jgi:hypothetical protein
MMADPQKLTDREILDAMRADTPLNRVRMIFCREFARMDQACRQRTALSSIEFRRMEFEAAEKLLDATVNNHDTLISALEFIRDGYANQDVNHVDYRVKVYQVALDALASVATPHPETAVSP